MKTLSDNDIGLLPETGLLFKRFRVNKFTYFSSGNDPMVWKFHYDTTSLVVNKFIIHVILPSDSRFDSTQNGFLAQNTKNYFYENIS
jgi:hypothetical protein